MSKNSKNARKTQNLRDRSAERQHRKHGKPLLKVKDQKK